MEQINSLLKRLANRQWYHQRFDGSPMFLSIVGGSETKKEARKPAGTEADWRVCFYGNGKADWFLDQEDIDRGAKIIIEMAKTSDHVSEDLMTAWGVDEQIFEQYFWQSLNNDYSELSDKDLLAEFNQYYTLICNRFTSSSIIDHFALGTDVIISKILRKEVGVLGKESEFSEIFSVATAPVHQSFINEAETSLLKIADKVKKGTGINSPKINELLLDHQSRYFWINNNYVNANILDIGYFKEEIRSWLESGKDLAKERRTIQETPARNKKAKENLFSKYHFSNNLLGLLKISENFTNWQDERKRSTYLSIHAGMEILKDMAIRRHINPDLLEYLISGAEVNLWFKDSAISAAELESRREGCVVIWEEHQQQVFTGQDVSKIRKAMLPTESYDDIKDIRGLVASTGRAIGTARVLMSAHEIDKVQPGEILIAVMTRPDYVPAMRRAAAIVTDEGGITSHAAIVARELGIPCIIGTKIATKVFKDGQKIEVNANHNWIRKV